MVASNTADLFNQLFSTFALLAFVVGGVVLALMAYLVVRFRGRDSYPEPADTPTLGRIPSSRGHRKNVLISVTLSAIVLSFLIFGTLANTSFLTTIPNECLPKPGSCVYVQVTAFRFGWNFTYGNGETLPGNLTIPVGRVVVLQITSKSEAPGRQAVFHSFGIDDYKVKKDAIPGLTNTLWFKASDLDPHTIRCFELCGIGHAGMLGRVNVVNQSGFQGFCSSSGC